MRVSHKSREELAQFDKSELVTVLVFTLIFTFVLTLRGFFEADVNAAEQLGTMLLVFMGMLIAVFMHEAGHKFVASKMGYATHIKLNGIGLVITAFVSLYSFGLLTLITPNLLRADARPDLRLNKFYRFENPSHSATIAGGGIVGTTLAIVLFNTLFQITGADVFSTIVFGAVLHGVYSLIPFELIPILQLKFFSKIEGIYPGDALHLWWASTWFYVFALVFMVVFGLLALSLNIVAYMVSALIAAGAAYIYVKALGSGS